mmetsp:Transcript_106402/g.166155  ORF Transcript_106402/g.166155 Transcript_106402/m.166155 type:complete len:239 (-) Transcript_106402:558-1274(-)
MGAAFGDVTDATGGGATTSTSSSKAITFCEAAGDRTELDGGGGGANLKRLDVLPSESTEAMEAVGKRRGEDVSSSLNSFTSSVSFPAGLSATCTASSKSDLHSNGGTNRGSFGVLSFTGDVGSIVLLLSASTSASILSTIFDTSPLRKPFNNADTPFLFVGDDTSGAMRGLANNGMHQVPTEGCCSQHRVFAASDPDSPDSEISQLLTAETTADAISAICAPSSLSCLQVSSSIHAGF